MSIDAPMSPASPASGSGTPPETGSAPATNTTGAAATPFDRCWQIWEADWLPEPEPPEARPEREYFERCLLESGTGKGTLSARLASHLDVSQTQGGPVRRVALVVVVAASDRQGPSPFAPRPGTAPAGQPAAAGAGHAAIEAQRRQVATVAEALTLGWLSTVEVAGVSPLAGVGGLWAFLCHAQACLAGCRERGPVDLHLVGLGDGADLLLDTLDWIGRFRLPEVRRSGARWIDQVLLIGANHGDRHFDLSGPDPAAPWQLPAGALIAGQARRVIVGHTRDDRLCARLGHGLPPGEEPLGIAGARPGAVRNVENWDLSGKLGCHDDQITALLCHFELLGRLRALLTDAPRAPN